MGLLETERAILHKMIDSSYCLGQTYGEKKKIRDKNRVNLLEQVQLSAEQKELIDNFYIKNYGKKVPYDWHRLYQSFTGRFSEQYVPEILFSSKIEPLFNNESYRYVLDDKLLLSIFCNNTKYVRIPRTIAAFCNGSYFDSDNNTYDKKEFEQYLSNCGKVIIKPVQNTSSGNGVNLAFFQNGKDKYSNKMISTYLDGYRRNSFIIQETIKPCRELKSLYPSAINTFRIVTYLWKGNVYHWPVTLRLGQGGSFLDNVHAGGMFIAVDDDGFLGDTAFTEYQERYKEHPDTHIVFEKYHLAFVPELIEHTKRMHLNVPQLGIISWDMSVDENGTFVLIEANTRGQPVWLPQSASGKPAFGENTAEILKYTFC